MKELLTGLFDALGMAWWIEIRTETPKCVYYFGPFAGQEEALKAKAGYIEDLEQEGATGILAVAKRCKPEKLTVADDLGERNKHQQPSPVLG